MVKLPLVPFSSLSSPGKNIITVLSLAFSLFTFFFLVVVRLPPRVYEILT